MMSCDFFVASAKSFHYALKLIRDLKLSKIEMYSSLARAYSFTVFKFIALVHILWGSYSDKDATENELKMSVEGTNLLFSIVMLCV